MTVPIGTHQDALGTSIVHFFFTIPTENLKGISKMSLLFIQAVKGADKLQITKYSAFFLGHPLCITRP